MTQYNTFVGKLSNSQLNKLKICNKKWNSNNVKSFMKFD